MNSSLKASDNWEAELDRTAFRYHKICCWVAIVFNPLFGVADYFNIPAHFSDFMTIRIVVAILTAIALGFHKKLKISSELLVLVPVLGISLQNAYMYSVMDVVSLQAHTLAYIALFIGVGMLALWKSYYSIIVVAISIIANITMFSLFSHLTTSQVFANGGLLTFTVAVFSIILIQTRYSLTKKELIARYALEDSNKQLAIQKDIIEEKNKSITDSINYAEKIQTAILPHYSSLQKCFPESFILFKPKDILSGDFYWLNHKEDCLFLAAADCTGHGVPGSLMSMLGSTFLNEIVNEKKITQPSTILFELRERVIAILKQNEGDSKSKDGMDIALCKIDFTNGTLTYSGAFNPLWLVRNDELIELKANKFPIGTYVGERSEFTEHNMKLEKGDCIYVFTDGYADQFGGPKGKKFLYKRMQKLLISMKNDSMEQQKKMLETTIDDWKKNVEQVDDILVIGVRV